ncbi:cupin domain-containing protein [Ignatzschineria rhizosphaerae]|uniref:Cupin domain-containing protein n=1 Tax=Ignatzschineria rhizosphaerae TaxID=2923279 RepID=A0ABY3X2K9_9GAMM|nr:cupin domain-containing protein [Ignatzschineria rhizosphaerae]UNM96130.1 cupin domain-containing protein [Ignatzschineria rhizosphaerae]
MAKAQPLSFLGGLTAETFLREYWQKKPLFVKNAFPNFEDPLSADEIAGLAFESFIPSRFIFEKGGERPWQLKMGPATEDDFATLKDKKWMLVVNDVEKNLPELKSMTAPFTFIPNWRLDDLQVSLGEDGGNVGAHWDDYDVFLIQGMGQKKWQISYLPVSEDDFLKGVDIRLIENFKVDEEWIVEPGDMLYLPPRIGHYGVNIGRSVTWSVGFRAPKHQEMFRDFIEMKFDNIAEDARFSDLELEVSTQYGELTDDAIDRVVKVIKEGLLTNRDEIAKWFGVFMTEPKMYQTPELLEEKLTLEAVMTFLDEGGALEVHPGLTFIHRQIGEQYYLFVGGHSYPLPKEYRDLITLIVNAEYLDFDDLEDYLSNNIAGEFITKLLNEGVLTMEEDE